MGMWEYPSQLNFSALRFERCGECNEPRTIPPSPSPRLSVSPVRSKSLCCDGDKAKSGYRREKSDNRAQRVKAKKNMKSCQRADDSEKCLNSILGDDLILCRLSALLAPLFDDPETAACKPALLRRVSSSDIDDACSDGRSDESLQKVPAFALIPGDTAVVLPQILPTDGDLSGPAQSLLSAVGIEEVEALDPANGGPSAGQCQFACVASALSKSFGLDRPLRDGYRPDLELRSLALHTVRMNPDMYRDFMTVAGGRTRKQNAVGGSSVDMNSYLRTMSSPSCDGDAVTLQALSDALKITIRVVKTVDATWYDEQRQRERLLGSASISSSSGRFSLGSESSDDDGASSVTSGESSFSSLSWSNNPYSSCEHMSFIGEIGDEENREGRRSERLYVSEEIQPRQLPCVDSRIRDVQNIARGRLIWLSHIGDEVHYRFLRPTVIPHKILNCEKPSSDMYTCNEEEARIARFSKVRRHHLLMNSRALEDGYARILNGDTQTNFRKGFDSTARESLEQRCADDPSLTPRCGLCLGALLGAWSDECKSPVSPSCCHHDYCENCIVSWGEHIGNNCPSCGCLFMALVDSLSGRIVRSFSNNCVSGTGTMLSLDAVACQRDKRRGDDSSISSCEENSGSMGNKVEGGLITAKHLAPSVHLILAELDASFAQAAAGLSRKKSQADLDQDSPKRLLQDLFIEIARNRRADADQVGDILEELLLFLTQNNAGAAADELLDTGLLRALRLLLSASRVSSPLRDTAVQVKDSKRHVVSMSLFLKSIGILEKITSLCNQEDLTWWKIQNGFGLPKLLLWYVTCNPYGVSLRHGVIDNTLQVLMQWSKHFGLSLVDAVHESKSRPKSCAKRLLLSSKPAQGAKKSAGTNPRPNVSKKRNLCAEDLPASSNDAATTRSKRARRIISVEDKRAINALLKEEKKPSSCARRAAGKRKVRPVNNFSVEMW
eukprot:CAMPEP_0113575000 /NCGR_PEP_ID=MMETSP0015_2-20120614/27444_1 /TAXON_ID=2838 /ORGANISM="Odontella" /LENGTH=950 /DNA_ID=CAMNT_0000478169 /DNA_START=89 /DNA_END=2941 /DNA_ORIENTATION=+ /assembly_acc=CAM_ASM_000160